MKNDLATILRSGRCFTQQQRTWLIIDFLFGSAMSSPLTFLTAPRKASDVFSLWHSSIWLSRSKSCLDCQNALGLCSSCGLALWQCPSHKGWQHWGFDSQSCCCISNPRLGWEAAQKCKDLRPYSGRSSKCSALIALYYWLAALAALYLVD